MPVCSTASKAECVSQGEKAGWGDPLCSKYASTFEHEPVQSERYQVAVDFAAQLRRRGSCRERSRLPSNLASGCVQAEIYAGPGWRMKGEVKTMARTEELFLLTYAGKYTRNSSKFSI